jgi:hypothetical protein
VPRTKYKIVYAGPAVLYPGTWYVVPLLKTKDLTEALLDTGEIVCVKGGEWTLDETLFNRHEIRKASCAGMEQAQSLPMLQRMIAATGLVVEARLAADRAVCGERCPR